jgi:CO/xanthine dehydrogenase Mo-binding subunit
MKANSSSRSEARVHLSQDGSAVAYAGTSEMGQGQRDNLRSLLAEFLQVPVEKTAVVMTDTGVVPFDSWTASSRSTVMMGNAVRAACDDVRSQLAQFARDHVGGGADEVIFRDGNVCVASKEIPMTQLLHVYSADGVTGNGTFATATNPAHPLGGAAPFFQVVATAVELHIDRDTGQVILDKVVHGGDAGKVINRRRAARIDEGGLMMGQSLTLSEELVFGASGELRNGSSLDYRIATVADLPAEMISGIYVENADGPGPFGAKGLAEGAILAIGPAICGAILDLTGVHVTRIPLTPERLWRALSEQAQRTAPAGAIPV